MSLPLIYINGKCEVPIKKVLVNLRSSLFLVFCISYFFKVFWVTHWQTDTRSDQKHSSIPHTISNKLESLWKVFVLLFSNTYFWSISGNQQNSCVLSKISCGIFFQTPTKYIYLESARRDQQNGVKI